MAIKKSTPKGCGRCRLPYPDEMLNPVIGSMVKEPVCGICALDIVNAVHGTRMKRFHGETAEDSRQRALNWRRKHPNAQPVGETVSQ